LSFAAVNFERYPWITFVIQRQVRNWMGRQVWNPETREKLIPKYDLGCKRPALSQTYLSSFNRPNVELVTAPITRIEDDCVICQDGTKKDIDVLILATGFQTTERSNAPRFPVTGPHERELGKFWDENGLQSYAGIAVKGFPNLFLASGPYSGGLNWFEMLRTHFGQIAKCLNKACDLKASRVEIGHHAHDRYVSEMRENSKRTVFKSGNCSSANSYYIDRHGEASLPSPRTPFWRAKFARRFGSRHFCFRSVGAKPD
jgi:cyclohexanone monooxygenase